MYLLFHFNIDIYSYSILKSDKKDSGNLRKCMEDYFINVFRPKLNKIPLY